MGSHFTIDECLSQSAVIRRVRERGGRRGERLDRVEATTQLSRHQFGLTAPDSPRRYTRTEEGCSNHPPHLREDVAALRIQPDPTEENHGPRAHRNDAAIRPPGQTRCARGARPLLSGEVVGIDGRVGLFPARMLRLGPRERAQWPITSYHQSNYLAQFRLSLFGGFHSAALPDPYRASHIV